ncbi:O-fucosyltransferase 36-like [Abeliophyllum distichum]|uniref:O-fucosyltransferase 36-like n=1 Tax=Abeliophyllum distichum TaxID=126358 RepID=A0ABD1W064_9LAMI
MERESSSDEEDDCENLISQNDTVKPPHRSTFEIGDIRTCLSNSTRRVDKRYLYLFAVFLPLFILILKLWNYSKLVNESYLTAVNNNSSVNLSVCSTFGKCRDGSTFGI